MGKKSLRIIWKRLSWNLENCLSLLLNSFNEAALRKALENTKKERVNELKVNKYQFDSIVSKTKKEINPIKRGEEDGIYLEYLALLESRMYQFHLKLNINGRQAKEILQLILYDIKSIISQQEYDCSKWEEDGYRSCADTIESFFVPGKNPDLQARLKENIVLNDDYFEFSRKNIIRIHESIDQWTKDFGPYGYFNFIGNYVGNGIQTSKQFLVEDRFLK